MCKVETARIIRKLYEKKEMVIDSALPYFKLISRSSGWLDYIETIGQWRMKFRKFNLKKYWLYLTLVPRFITDKKFRHLRE